MGGKEGRNSRMKERGREGGREEGRRGEMGVYVGGEVEVSMSVYIRTYVLPGSPPVPPLCGVGSTEPAPRQGL